MKAQSRNEGAFMPSWGSVTATGQAPSERMSNRASHEMVRDHGFWKQRLGQERALHHTTLDDSLLSSMYALQKLRLQRAGLPLPVLPPREIVYDAPPPKVWQPTPTCPPVRDYAGRDYLLTSTPANRRAQPQPAPKPPAVQEPPRSWRQQSFTAAPYTPQFHNSPTEPHLPMRHTQDCSTWDPPELAHCYKVAQMRATVFDSLASRVPW